MKACHGTTCIHDIGICTYYLTDIKVLDVILYFIAVVGLNWYEILKLFEPIEIMNILFVKQNPAMLIFLRMNFLQFGDN